MILFPAIDLKDGQAVRLLRGEMDSATVFNADPADQARKFADLGFSWLHLVDLNGAFAGKPVNGPAVEEILKAIDLPVQLGGGIRDLVTIEHWLGLGVARVILGTAAVKDPELVIAACRKFPGRIAVGIDARGGKVAVEGWAEQSELEAGALAARFRDAGVAAVIYTDIERDGALGGVNVEATARLARESGLPTIASGGVASLEDLAAVAAREKDGVIGAISGRALYDGRLQPAAALALLAEAERRKAAEA